MMSTTTNQTCESAPRIFLALKNINNCVPIEKGMTQELLDNDSCLNAIFDGYAVSSDFDLILDTFLVCDEFPKVVMMPIGSVYGNRFFLCDIDSAWYHFLLPYCIYVDRQIVIDVCIRTIDSLPSHIILQLKPKAQGLFDFNAVHVSGNQLIESLFGHIHSVLDHVFF